MEFQVRNISYRYSPEGKNVLKNLSFGIGRSEITAIVGPSGCGKSTLVSVLSGVIPALISTGVLSGSVDVGGEVSISVVSQSPEDQLFGYSVEDAVSFGVENMGLRNEDICERVEFVLDLLNIQHLRRRSVATLSGGQRQAVCIASVLAMRPDIVIMDEPVSSLDPNGKKMIRSVLTQMRSAGQTTVIVDNNLSWFADIADRIVGLLDGEVVFDGDRDKFFDDFDLQDKLGVTIPQEVQIYRELSGKIKGLRKFSTVGGAIEEIKKYIPAGKSAGTCSESGDRSQVILEAHEIHKTFNDGFHALIHLSAEFKKGRVISILGQNGSGKTTLVKHLNGLYRPTKGAVRYKGEETAGKSVAQISRDIILVFQHPEHMLFEKDVLSELTFCAKAQGVNFSEEDALNVLRKYGLLDFKDELPVNLPMGKKHLLTILSVLFSSADVIIFDEPTLGMDLHLKNSLERIILGLKESGKTVIIISHEIPLVFKVTDEIVILNEGRKLEQGEKQSIALDDELFRKIGIELPPAVVLSKYFGLPQICFDAASFAQAVAARLPS